MQKLLKIAIPGSLMLFGEHAVLHGKQAIVCAIDKYIKITLQTRNDKNIKITSALGELNTSLENLTVKKPFEFVLAAIKNFTAKNKINFGFELKIESDFSHTIGFGSSAAVTVGTVAVLHLATLGKLPDKRMLLDESIKVIHDVQKIGSGADVAASIYGGIIAYKINEPAKHIANAMPLTVIYSGSKMPTAEVINYVAKLHLKHPVIYADLFALIGKCSKDAINAIKKQNWQLVGELMNINAGLQDAMGVSNLVLNEIIFKLRREPNIFGAKISGSGLGDCVIGLGNCEVNLGYQQIPVKISSTGVIVL